MAASLLQCCVLVFTYLSLCSAQQAPGDERFDRCTRQVDSDNEKTLMDSYHYANLLPGNGTGFSIEDDAVWNDRSYDGNDAIDLNNPTYWQQGAGGTCRYQVRVCAFDREGALQNNWLFTQHINKVFDANIYNYPVDMRLEIRYSGISCRPRHGCNPNFSILSYITNNPQLASTVGNGYMNRNNYGDNRTISPEETSTPYTEIHNFTLQPSQTGLYLAIQDYGTCLSISRMRVYHNNCKGRQTGLVIYPDAPAPVVNPVNINIRCVDNATFVGSDEVSCHKDGTWSAEIPECQCNLGFENTTVETKCTACPAGTYRSSVDETCQQCPSNTVMDIEAAPQCECLPGYFRDDVDFRPIAVVDLGLGGDGSETAADECTRPPGPPGSIVLEPSETSITVSWSRPSDEGGRTDLYYQVEHSDPDNFGSFTGTVYLTSDSTTYTLTGLTPYTQYCVRVIAHNGVSDQDSDRIQSRTVENCTETPEAKPGPVVGVEGHCSVVVWNEPEQPNGVIINYALLFYLNTGNDSGVLIETEDITTNFVIKSSNQLSLIPDDMDVGLFVKVLAQNGAGKGEYSQPSYIGCTDPPGDIGNVSVPSIPPMEPESVAVVIISGDTIVWERPDGRISYYMVTVQDEEGNTIIEITTNEQFVSIPEDITGHFVVEICTVLDGVHGNCTTFYLLREELTECTEEEEEGLSTRLILTACVSCGATALLVGTITVLIAMCHHCRYKRQFGPNKEALTWEAYSMKKHENS